MAAPGRRVVGGAGRVVLVALPRAPGWPGRRLVLTVSEFATWLADVSVAADREKGVRLLINSRLPIPCETLNVSHGR